MLFNDAQQPGKWSGNYTNNFGYMESSGIRRSIAEMGKDAYVKKMNEGFAGEYSIDETDFEDLEDKTKPVKLYRTLTIDGSDKASIIYFSPMLNNAYKENPFKADTREYPVEMPYRMDDIYIFKLEIPAGYVIDEIPKSEKALYNDDEGFFEYIIAQSDKDITLRSRIKFEKAIFSPEEYAGLKEFFGAVVRKHAEKIVFKKK